MGELANLLRYKKPLDLVDENGKVIKKVWIRVLGDFDLGEAYRFARVASAKKRTALRDKDSLEYFEEVVPVQEASREDRLQLIKTAQAANFYSEAVSAIDQEELPTLKDIASDPDAPTLEEQERLDAAIKEVKEKYDKEVQEYQDTKMAELEVEISALNDEELLLRTQLEVSNITSLSVFINEVQAQKVFRGVFMDEACKIKAFDSTQEFIESSSVIKEQLTKAYQKLEMNPTEVKN